MSLTQTAEALSRTRATEGKRTASKREAMVMLRTPRPPPRTGHIFSGIEVAAAGVIPFVHHRAGVYFLMQELCNGTRAGLLSDFGGRREASDLDAYHTAARELDEETSGAFGDVHALAVRLRNEATIRILNKSGRYVTFFLEVPYIHHTRIQHIDPTTSEGGVARECKWLRAEQVIGEVERGHVFARLLQRPDPARAGAASPRGPAQEGPTSLHRAVLKTVALEGHPYAKERWHATVLANIMEAAAKEEASAEQRQSVAFAAAAAATGASSERSPRRKRWHGGWHRRSAPPVTHASQFAP